METSQTGLRPVNILQWIDQYDWLILLILIPFFLFMHLETSWVLLILPLLWGISLLAKNQPINITPINGIMLLLAFQVLVSLYATYDIVISLPKIAMVLYSIALFFAFVRLSKQTWGIIACTAVLGSAGLGIAVLGLFGTNWATTKITILNPLYELFPKIQELIPGLIEGFHPNEVAGAIIWVLPVWIALLGWIILRGKKIMQYTRLWGYFVLLLVGLLGTIVIGVVLVFTQSRSAYLGFAVGIVLMSFLFTPRKLKWIFGIFVLVVAGLLIFFILNGQFMIFINSLFPGTGISTTAFSINTLSGRVEIWSRAIYAIQDFAFTGMGMNTFRHIVHVLYPLYTVSPDLPIKDIGHAHNEFLQSALDLGIPGMIAFISLNISAFWMLFSNMKILQRRSHRPLSTRSFLTREFYYAISVGLIGGLFAHFLFGITDAIALGAKPGVLFWIMLSLATSIFMKTQKRDFL
ncbi:MAG: O-antigen ligase family protein [Anaerolineaceae bacterium]